MTLAARRMANPTLASLASSRVEKLWCGGGKQSVLDYFFGGGDKFDNGSLTHTFWEMVIYQNVLPLMDGWMGRHQDQRLVLVGK